LAGQSQAQLTIVTDDLSGNTVGVALAPFAPGVYSSILINGTNTLAAPGNPAKRGVDYIDLFATGLGPVTHQPATGAPAPTVPLAETTNAVTVSIGGVTVKAAFAGLAPGYVGLYQVNVLVPANAPVGDAIPVALSVGGVTANQVTISVQ
jgi:uncharacterized protein (TIGR03437 family)